MPFLLSFVGITLFLLACIGHGYWLMIILNRIYSRPFHRAFLRTLRKIAGLFLVFGPILFGLFVGWNLLTVWERAASDQWLYLPLGYAAVCLFFGGLMFPVVTLKRACRRPPVVVISEKSTFIDVEREFGERPLGNGKHKHVAAWKWNQLFRVELTEIQLALPNLPPEWEGLSILHLSDFHFYGTPDLVHFEFLMKQAMQMGKPDLVVISGDIIDDDQYLAWIKPVFSLLSWNIAAVAILGNHDWWQDADDVRKELTQLGIQVISYEPAILHVRGQRMIIVGHEGPWFRPEPKLHGLPEGFRLLVSHSPDNINWAKANDFTLMLAGHNHGGQIRIPIIGSMFVPSWYSRKFDGGTFQEGPTTLHVTRGLAGKEPIRFNCPPQISRITLAD